MKIAYKIEKVHQLNFQKWNQANTEMVQGTFPFLKSAALWNLRCSIVSSGLFMPDSEIKMENEKVNMIFEKLFSKSNEVFWLDLKRQHSILWLPFMFFVCSWALEVNSWNAGNEGSLAQRRGRNVVMFLHQIFSNHQPKRTMNLFHYNRASLNLDAERVAKMEQHIIGLVSRKHVQVTFLPHKHKENYILPICAFFYYKILMWP